MPETGARTLWRELAGAGAVGALWRLDGQVQPQVDAERLGDLLADLDARLEPGLVLSACVQAATVVPLLHTLARASPLAAAVRDAALRGEAVVALAATDAAVSGSALLHAGTELCPDGRGTLLRGGKDWITNACGCDYALVLARHRPGAHFTSFRWALVPAGLDGVTCEPVAGELFAGAGLGHLRFDGVRLGDEHLVGRPGRALAEFALHVATERLAGALWGRALCLRVLRATRRRLAGRSTGRGTLWDNPAVRERFARCLVELGRIEALCATSRERLGTAAGAMLLKAACAEGVDRILAECVGLHGAEAFHDGGVARLREQAAMFGIAGGASGAMLAGVAEHADDLLGGRA